MEISPIAVYRGQVSGKFGVPRQSGLAPSLRGEVQLLPPYDRSEALRGLEGFGRIWLIWGFSLNGSSESLTVRPPRLGGNERVGVFASRSPFRPNGLGLSCVEVHSVDAERAVIHVLGADLADGTPVFDIKPYIPYADAWPESRAGFVDAAGWKPLKVVFAPSLPAQAGLNDGQMQALAEILSQDPRPQYQDDPGREYGLTFAGRNVRFRVKDGVLTVTGVE